MPVRVRSAQSPGFHQGPVPMPDINFFALAPTRARSGEDPLIGFLLGARGGAATISAREVSRLDSHRLQMLLVARRQWMTEGREFRVTDMSPVFREGLERHGLAANHFDEETAQ